MSPRAKFSLAMIGLLLPGGCDRDMNHEDTEALAKARVEQYRTLHLTAARTQAALPDMIVNIEVENMDAGHVIIRRKDDAAKD